MIRVRFAETTAGRKLTAGDCFVQVKNFEERGEVFGRLARNE